MKRNTKKSSINSDLKYIVDELNKKTETENVTIEEPVMDEKKIEELKKELDNQDTIIRDLSCENSIAKDIGKVHSDKKTFTEEEVREKIGDVAFIGDVMKKFNHFINEQAKSFMEQTKNYEDIEEESPNVLLRIAPNNEKDREVFKERLLSYGEKRRPIYITVGGHDLFFEQIDKDDYPVFSFNRQNLVFFFKNDLKLFKEYLESNNLMVEILENKKKKKEEVKSEKTETIEQSSDIKESVKEEIKEEIIKNDVINTNHKKVCKVKFTDKNSLFVLTEDPSNIFKEYDGKVYSIKIIGEGITI